MPPCFQSGIDSFGIRHVSGLRGRDRKGDWHLLFWNVLAAHGDAIALRDPVFGDINYDRLNAEAKAWADRFADIARRLSAPGGKLLLGIEIAPRFPVIAAYLGALQGGHPVILSAPGGLAPDTDIAGRYRPNAVLSMRGNDCTLAETDAPCAVLHEDLALLLSTSGTTGDPRLVRLSAENIDSNARSIASYLSLGPDERAINSLPLHYSYGLSVLHSHLTAGARLILTDVPVTEPAFISLFRDQRATSLALVPHQIEMMLARKLDFAAIGPLRYITQAGGRLAPRRVQQMVRHARDGGWNFVVMYGQTEAAPRMSYVPPEDLEQNADTIGRAIPGGRLWIADADGREIGTVNTPGELVYDGPNVMLGYARTRDDLALGRAVTSLHTGDIAERTAGGYFRIVGRLKRFVKLYGLRLNLDQIEAQLAEAALPAHACGIGDRLVIMTALPGQEARIAALLSDSYELPRGDIVVATMPDVPRLSNGKTDQRAIEIRARAALEAAQGSRVSSFATALASATRVSTVAPTDSFISLGGDSLGYLQVQMALEDLLGYVPEGWEHLTLSQFEALVPRPPQKKRKLFQTAQLDADVLVRIAATTCIILSHLHVQWPFHGGTSALLLLMGASVARFQRGLLAGGALGNVALNTFYPVLAVYFAMVIGYDLLRGDVATSAYLLTANVLHTGLNAPLLEPLWFISLYAQIVVVILAAAMFAGVRRAMSTAPFTLGVIAMLASSALSVLWQWYLPDGTWMTRFENPWPLVVGTRAIVISLPLACLGWAAATATTNAQKLLVLPLTAVFWMLYPVELTSYLLLILAAMVTTVTRMRVTLPLWMVRLARKLAAAALFVYVLHNIVLNIVKHSTPIFDTLGPVLTAFVAVPLCFAAGVLLHLLFEKGDPPARGLMRRIMRQAGAARAGAGTAQSGQPPRGSRSRASTQSLLICPTSAPLS